MIVDNKVKDEYQGIDPRWMSPAGQEKLRKNYDFAMKKESEYGKDNCTLWRIESGRTVQVLDALAKPPWGICKWCGNSGFKRKDGGLCDAAHGHEATLCNCDESKAEKKYQEELENYG